MTARRALTCAVLAAAAATAPLSAAARPAATTLATLAPHAAATLLTAPTRRLAASLAAPTRAAPTPPAASDPAAGLSWTLPAGWEPVRSQLTALVQPVHRLAAATFPLRQDAPDRDCGPETARAQIPAGGALVYLLEDREAEARPKRLAHYPARPRHFRVARARTYECLGLGAIVWWTEQGRALQAQVVLGPRAGAARRHQVEALLDSLVVQAIAPPAPPTGWRSVVSGAYDSMRVPPGWQAHALKRVHTTPRSRRLFRVANPADTVVVRVTEQTRGRPSPAFPPAASALVFDAHRRAGLSFRGFRFSIRIFTRPGSSASDLAWAEISARSLGVSGVGRG
ncbi:hypothetical protein OM076_16925 [Solirubrobacter ginsenosidimutans]|uniref:Uncharacterized protein n=1 Tax=Solirubrobacter ginsenosidimutans TaxID=490573 RepID=A0A9X3MVE2_9ACTN|nr:hypothetical protein [Solirubrobacter ginsenosidimutans]MDA0161960.1 hypothetical protein [Solirubrobacter ginsenosidimutans]